MFKKNKTEITVGVDTLKKMEEMYTNLVNNPPETNTNKILNILGTNYTVKEIDEFTDDFAGITNFISKTITINKNDFSKETLRHEIIHAYLFESGLHSNSEWANNEEMVDWFALQWNKINRTIDEYRI